MSFQLWVLGAVLYFELNHSTVLSHLLLRRTTAVESKLSAVEGEACVLLCALKELQCEIYSSSLGSTARISCKEWTSQCRYIPVFGAKSIAYKNVQSQRQKTGHLNMFSTEIRCSYELEVQYILWVLWMRNYLCSWWMYLYLVLKSRSKVSTEMVEKEIKSIWWNFRKLLGNESEVMTNIKKLR